MIDAAGSDAGFEAVYRVRFDEAGPDGRLRTSGLLRYTQDLAAQHSEALGYDRAWYAARGLTWLVRAAEIEVLGAIPYGVDLLGTTTRRRLSPRLVPPCIDVLAGRGGCRRRPDRLGPARQTGRPRRGSRQSSRHSSLPVNRTRRSSWRG